MTPTYSNLMLISTIVGRKCTSTPFMSKHRYFLLFLSSPLDHIIMDCMLYMLIPTFLSQPEESKRTNRSIDDRKFALDAAFLRIMKARKMTYEHLKAPTIDAVRSHFVPQVDIVKKRIDVLLKAEYLERSKDDRNRYNDVA